MLGKAQAHLICPGTQCKGGILKSAWTIYKGDSFGNLKASALEAGGHWDSLQGSRYWQWLFLHSVASLPCTHPGPMKVGRHA